MISLARFSEVHPGLSEAELEEVRARYYALGHCLVDAARALAAKRIGPTATNRRDTENVETKRS